MIRIMTDFNTREGDTTIVLRDDAPAEALVVGARIILYEPGDIECEAIVRRGETWPWVADIVKGTVVDPPDDGESQVEKPGEEKF
jgi:hypothetical protein